MTFELDTKLNRDIARRDKLIFGGYDQSKYCGGVRRFECNVDLMNQLIKEGFADPDECQNDSPFIKDFMDTVDGDESVRFECYAVDVNRDDCRVTIEGIRAYIPDTDYDRINLYVEQFRYADEFTFEHQGDCFYLRAWWD